MKRALTHFILLVLLFAFTACAGGAGQTTSSLSAPAVEALAVNRAAHDGAGDADWDSSTAIPIVLNGDSITAGGAGVTVDGAMATITAAGTYILSGALADGGVIVNTEDDGLVRLVLNGVDLNSSTGAPIYIAGADETVIILADGTENTVTDAGAYIFESAEAEEPNAAIFSKSDLTIAGGGSLTVTGSYKDGIASKDGLVIAGGTITVEAVDDGLRGKDYLVVRDGMITVNTGGDGLKSDDAEDSARGYIWIEAGVLQVASGGDAINAQTDVIITGGQFALTTGGGSGARADETTSAKGIKAAADLIIDSGSFTIDSADDALHSNADLKVAGGVFTLASADDGMHADSTLEVSGGEIRITVSYEGIESSVITINAGQISIVASDDGLNVAAGVDGSGSNAGMRPGGGFGPGGVPSMGGGPGQDAFTYTGDNYLYINGGAISIDAAGDGIDVNGAIQMTGGVVLVNGPTEQMNGALDYDGGFNLSGGLLIAAGSAGMAQAPDSGSGQYSALAYFSSMQPAGTLVHIQDSAGEQVLTFAPAKAFQSIAFSSPALVDGASYTIYLGGRSTGTSADGLYQGGAYTPGEPYASFTISAAVTTIGSGRNRP